jgi:DNA invertase Pin-like site-specific DNA recombinase
MLRNHILLARNRPVSHARNQSKVIHLSDEFLDRFPMLIGYARVSTHDQNLDLQKDALAKAGCEKVLVDIASGNYAERSGLLQAKELLRAGDLLVVWRLDRLGRSLKDLIATLTELESRGVGFLSLTEAIDTTTSSGKLIFHVLGAITEFERNLIRDRTQAGLVAARARGRQGGRPRALNATQRAMAVELYQQRKHTIGEICEAMGISRTTLYNYLKA